MVVCNHLIFPRCILHVILCSNIKINNVNKGERMLDIIKFVYCDVQCYQYDLSYSKVGWFQVILIMILNAK